MSLAGLSSALAQLPDLWEVILDNYATRLIPMCIGDFLYCSRDHDNALDALQAELRSIEDAEDKSTDYDAKVELIRKKKMYILDDCFIFDSHCTASDFLSKWDKQWEKLAAASTSLVSIRYSLTTYVRENSYSIEWKVSRSRPEGCVQLVSLVIDDEKQEEENAKVCKCQDEPRPDIFEAINQRI